MEFWTLVDEINSRQLVGVHVFFFDLLQERRCFLGLLVFHRLFLLVLVDNNRPVGYLDRCLCLLSWDDHLGFGVRRYSLRNWRGGLPLGYASVSSALRG